MLACSRGRGEPQCDGWASGFERSGRGPDRGFSEDPYRRIQAAKAGGRAMKYRKLGNTGLIVSEVALGTMQFQAGLLPIGPARRCPLPPARVSADIGSQGD